MENIENLYQPISNIVFMLKLFFISIFTFYTNIKILGTKLKYSELIFSGIILVISIIIINIVIEYTNNYMISIMLLNFVLSSIFSINTKNPIGYSIVINTISLGINYSVYFIAIILGFFPAIIFNVTNDYINLLIIVVIYSALLNLMFRIKRIKNGIGFLRDNIKNEYFDILILSISVTVVLAASILNNLNDISEQFASNLLLALLIFTTMMIVTVQKTLTMYYKHKKLIEELNETKEELENTKKDRDKVEQENIEISKTNHSISHKIKSLNSKIDKLMMNSEIANEIDFKDRINKISKEYNKEKVTVELSKTGIEVIDDMLECMKEECIENNIEFELQLSGNIHHMTNNYIPKEELEILLADHIKDAIIAIKHTDNINHSILVRLGLIDEFYSLYIYDSGIEFEIDTLINLGTKAITTHADEGGTGMGFLNTFDTLKKHKASMVIDEIGKPSKDNYTKVIMIKLDNKNEFKIKSYRAQDIEQKGINNNMRIDIK